MSATVPEKSVFVIDDQVFTSPNTPTFPLRVPAYYESMPDWTTPDDARQLSWSDNAYPQLAYIPRECRFEGPIFQRLAYSTHNVPIEQVGRGWRLSSATKSDWLSLERALRGAAAFLMEEAHTSFPLDFTYFRLPSQYGWDSLVTKKYARKIAMRARDAFLPLMALVSYAISLVQRWHLLRENEQVESGNPYWARLLIEKARIHPGWVASLQESVVADFSPDIRVGTIVHVDKCLWLSHIGAMQLAKVPIWFYWGNVGSLFPSDWVKYGSCNQYRPTPAEIHAEQHWRYVRKEQNQVEENQEENNLEENVPKPTHRSRQKRGETWQAFFARHAEIRAEKIATETEHERQRRLNRERHAENHQAPSRRKGGPMVFRWIEEGHFRIRTKVTRLQVEDIWDCYSNTQRRFDGINNEWDLCTEFDPSGSPEMDEDFVADNDYGNEDGALASLPRVETPLGPPPYPPQSPVLLADIPPNYWSDDLLNFYGSEGYDETSLNVSSLDDNLFFWYGFDYTDGSFDNVQPDPNQWNEVRKILVDRDAEISLVLRAPIIELVMQLLSQQPSLPGSIWDLSDSSPSSLRLHANPNIIITPIRFNTRLLYSIEPVGHQPSNEPPWVLLVSSATAAVQCLRQTWGPSRRQVARFLVERGIPFHTRLAIEFPSVLYKPSPYIGLGWRAENYHPDAADYAAYETTRNAFLRFSHARAALLSGGILWRLAMEALQPNDALQGPSRDIINHGAAILSSNGVQYWDDNLSEDERDLICGVYKVDTSQADQSSDQSWWPKHSVWERSGYNVGYWTRDCEIWYQKRLESIRSGSALLRSSRQWKTSLKMHHKTHKLVDAYDRVAAMYLAGHHFN